MRSSGCRMWSELLNWQRLTPSFAGGPMLIDTHVLSPPHKALHSNRTSSIAIVMFSITWPCRAKPSTGLGNLRVRQPRSANNDNILIHNDIIIIKTSNERPPLRGMLNSFKGLNFQTSLWPIWLKESSFQSHFSLFHTFNGFVLHSLEKFDRKNYLKSFQFSAAV